MHHLPSPHHKLTCHKKGAHIMSSLMQKTYKEGLSYSMARSKEFMISLIDLFHTTIIYILVLSPRLAHSVTLDSDVEALRSIKRSVDPATITKSSFLATWNDDRDPCESSGDNYLGILCTFPLDNSSSRISVIDLEGNGLEGFLSPEVGDLTELTMINLRDNQFRGPVPATIINLGKLTNLLLSGNFFSGSLPPDMNLLNNLVNIDVSRNRLSGSIPNSINGLRSLKLLDLSDNEMSGRIPDLTGLWQLNTLDISSNQIYGNLPPLPVNLRSLSVSRNLLAGRISNVRRLQHLRILDLSDNRFTDSILPEIFMLPMINRLNFSLNRFTDIQVRKFTGTDTQLQVVDVHGNHLHGRLPVNLATYVNLRTVDLGQNQFTGRIPMEYGERIGNPWRRLSLDHNFLGGTLPPKFSSNAGLRMKGSLARNCLTCPPNFPLCRGGQRPASECIGQNDNDTF